MDIIADKYRVLKTLGHGAMGEVYLVLPPRGDPVALKLLKTLDEKANQNAVDQFENEFKVLKRLSHPNIGRIYDYGYDKKLKKVFFTLPWLKGTDIYKATKNLPFEECEEIFIQTLRALNYLHQKHLIHCDLKPGNIYVEEGKALLIDFGLAGYFGDFIVGTPTYLAPEIFQGSHHNVSSDLYAMGIIFYNCLTRTQPFSGKTLQEIFDRHRTLTPPPIHEINKKVPKYFSDIVSILLNKKPEERFPTAAAVIEEIATFSKKKYPIETEETLLSYLPTKSEMIGRKDILLDIQSHLNGFLAEKPESPFHVILMHGRKHVGKSKIVHKICNDLQLSKVSVERALPPFQENDRDILMTSQAIIFENVESYHVSQEEEQNLQEVKNLLEQKIIGTETSKFLFIATSTRESDLNDLLKLFPEEATSLYQVEILPYTKEETEDFLTTVIGQKEIPKTFIDQFYRNTEGLPEIANELIENMIEDGLLFDKSGRWNEDLLADLEKAFDHLEISESLEQEFERAYAALTDLEEEIVNWLCLSPHGLTQKQIEKLVKSQELEQALEKMKGAHLLRQEGEHYYLYRKIFQNFIQENLPTKEFQKRHTILALPETGLPPKWALHHLTFSHKKELAIKAGVKLAKVHEKEGEREEAVKVYKGLLADHQDVDTHTRMEWALEMSILLIWLDRFKEAQQILTQFEKEIKKTNAQIDFEKFLILLEKKGLSLLHLHEKDKAKTYFVNGLKASEKNKEFHVHTLRFMNDLAQIELLEGHFDKAIQIFTKTRQAAHKLDVQHRSVITNNDLAHVYVQHQKYDQSLPYLKEDLKVYAEMKNREPLARALYSFAQVLYYQKRIDKAIQAYHQCIQICKKAHLLHLLLRAYNGLGNLYVSSEKHDEAVQIYQKAIELSIRLQDSTSKAALLFNQGYIYKNQSNYALAQRRFLTAIQVIENNPKKIAYDHMLLAHCYNALALLSINENNNMKALSYLIERAQVAEKMDMGQEEKFAIRYDLAEAYLNNRLHDQFTNELNELSQMAETDEQKEKVTKLNQEWKSIEDFAEQDSTGKIDYISS